MARGSYVSKMLLMRRCPLIRTLHLRWPQQHTCGAAAAHCHLFRSEGANHSLAGWLRLGRRQHVAVWDTAAGACSLCHIIMWQRLVHLHDQCCESLNQPPFCRSISRGWTSGCCWQQYLPSMPPLWWDKAVQHLVPLLPQCTRANIATPAPTPGRQEMMPMVRQAAAVHVCP